MLPQKILDFTLQVLDFALQVHNFSSFAHNKVRHSLLLKCVHRNLTQFNIGGQLSTSIPIFSSGLSMHTNRNELIKKYRISSSIAIVLYGGPKYTFL